MKKQNLNNKMKGNLTLWMLAIAIGFAACAPASDPSTEELQNTIDSLSGNIEKSKKMLAAAKEQMAALDTSKKVILTEVRAGKLQKQKFEHFFTIQGNVEAEKNAQIFPESQGPVTNIYVTEGQKVTKGQKLMRLDTDIMSKNRAELVTQLNFAKDIFERQKRLHDQNIGSEVQFLEAKNRKESLENSISTLDAQTGKSIVRAPFAGIVESIMPKIGEMASPIMPVAQVIDLGKVYLKADVSETHIGEIKKGDKVYIEFPGIADLEAEISRVGSTIKSANRTFEITVDLPKNNEMLKPNLIADIKVRDYAVDSAVVIPSEIVQQNTLGQTFVYVLEKEGQKYKAKKVLVKTNQSYNDQIEIVEGLQGDELLVRDGGKKISDGEEVEMQEMASKKIAQKN